MTVIMNSKEDTIQIAKKPHQNGQDLSKHQKEVINKKSNSVDTDQTKTTLESTHMKKGKVVTISSREKENTN